ncbi:MAG: hydroxyisourate hydrolase [Pirellulales bacterium]
MTSISTHVLDTSRGAPAAGIRATLYQLQTGSSDRTELKRATTNADGRIGDFYSAELSEATVFCLVFDTEEYFARTKTATFYPKVEIFFRVAASEKHYHVPLLLAPFGYSTYRGS